MIWRNLVVTQAAWLCLLPQLGFAQDEAATSAPTEVETETPTPAPDTASASTSTSISTSPSSVEETPGAPRSSAQGLLGDLRIGPSISVGIPHPITGAVDFVYADLLNVSISGGRSGTEFDDTEIEIRNWDVAVRWFPFGGTFFVGAAYGQQGIVGKRTETLDVDAGGTTLKVPTTVRLEIESKYLTPQLGWFARWDSGFTLGFDLGVQLPSSTTSNLQTSFANVSQAGEAAVKASQDYRDTEKDVTDAAELIGEKAIPYINLIRVGWLF